MYIKVANSFGMITGCGGLLGLVWIELLAWVIINYVTTLVKSRVSFENYVKAQIPNPK